MGWALALAAIAIAFAVAECRRERAARRQLAALQAVVAQQQRSLHRLVKDNVLLDHWCGRFRDLYIATVAQIDPAYAAELRAKWAQVQAPSAVARLLERVRHG
jgi:hypothetical protein